MERDSIAHGLDLRLPDVGEPAYSRMRALLEGTAEQLESAAHILKNPSRSLWEQSEIEQIGDLPTAPRAACQGVPGAYSQIACEQLFPQPDIAFFDRFGQVVEAVSSGEAEFGVLPVENSNAGAVEEALELVAGSVCYIVAATQVKANHCLCIHPDSAEGGLTRALSHPQALRQCGGFLKERGLEPVPCLNTAIAAMEVAKGPSADACLCSRRSAELYGLRILGEGVQDYEANFTRFVCIAKKALVLPDADTVSLALSFPNQPDALRRFLTLFSVWGLDLTKLRSLPIAGADFRVRFHLDFRGNVFRDQVDSLLGHMTDTLEDFRFLGNYPFI